MKTLMKLFAGISVFIFTLEICARLDDAIKYEAPLWGAYSADRLEKKDSNGLPYNVPNARFEKWQHNSLGFRGPEVMQIKPSGTVRVVCLGSSESYGLFESPGKEWPAQLQELLPSPKYEIINASLVGFNLMQYGDYLKKHVFALQPDIVVLIISPIMYVSVLETAAEKNSSPQKTEVNSKAEGISLAKNLVENIRIIPKIKQVLKEVSMDNFPGLLKKYRLWNMEKQIEEIERVRLKGRIPMDSIPDIYLDSFRDELNRLIELIRSRGIEVMLTSYPTLMSHDNIAQYLEIYLDGRRFNIYFSLKGMINSVSKLNTVIEHVAVDKKTMFFDPSLVIPKSTDYYGDLFHLTDKGAEKFAEGVSLKLHSKLSVLHASVH